jgi:hypothetical protein
METILESGKIVHTELERTLLGINLLLFVPHRVKWE